MNRTGKSLKLLAVRISRLGDLLFTTPALQLLRRSLPEARIDVLTATATAAAIAGLPFLDQVHVVPRPSVRFLPWIWTLTRHLAHRYDAVLSFSARPHHRWLATSLRAPVTCLPPDATPVRAAPSHPEILVEPRAGRVDWDRIPAVRPVRRIEANHLVQAHCQVVARYLGLQEYEVPPLAVQCSERDRFKVECQLRRSGIGPPAPYIALHPGFHGVRRGRSLAESGRRAWPREYWIELATQLSSRGLAVILTTGTATEKRIADEIARAAGRDVWSWPRTSIGQLAALLEGASLFVGVDSGPMHIAAAVATPVVCLFGPSRPELTGPWTSSGCVRIVRANLPCSPCKGLGVDCARNQCMSLVEPADVLQAAESLLRVTVRAS